jgi:hypothetical protein
MENGMHPKTLFAYERMSENGVSSAIRDVLVGPRHFHVGAVVFRVATDAMSGEIGAAGPGGKLVFPCGARLPGPDMVLTFEHPKGHSGPIFLSKKDEAIEVYSYQDSADMDYIGAFVPGTDLLRTDSEGRNNWGLMFLVAMMLSLINEPRIVDTSPATGLDWSRQHRKAVERVTGKVALAFSTVRWKVGSKTRAKAAAAYGDWYGVALHWCRAHWRHAKEGQPKAEWVNIPRKGGWGWYCWAPDCWKGHPDFGVKLQRHEPHLGEPRSRFVGGEKVLDSTRFAAMGAAHRAAMVEAGFAPSRSLH